MTEDEAQAVRDLMASVPDMEGDGDAAASWNAIKAAAEWLLVQRDAALVKVERMRMALLSACVDGDYCYCCERHPSSSGHAADCPVRP